MSAMKDFVAFVIAKVPDFLMAEPVCYFVGFFFLFVVIAVLRQLLHISR